MTEAEMLLEIEAEMRMMASGVSQMRQRLKLKGTSSETTQWKINLRRRLQEMDKLMADHGV